MSVGEHLDQAAAGLARAHALLLEARPGSALEQASVAVSRTRLFRELERHSMLVAGNSSRGERAIEQAGRDHEAPAYVAVRTYLRAATATAQACMPVALPEVPATGEMAVALRRAVLALGAANDLLAGNLGAGRSHPPTPEGVALAAGYGQRANLAAVGSFVRFSAELDERLGALGWLSAGADAGEWRPLLMAVEADLRRTDHAALQVHALRLRAGGDDAKATMRRVNPVPVIEDPGVWARVDSGSRAMAALDAARAWMLREGHGLTAAQTAATARAALVITTYVGHVLRSVDGRQDTAATARRASAAWRDAGLAAASLHSGAAPNALSSTAVVAMRAVAQWLDGRLCRDGDWREVQDWADTPGQKAVWRLLAGELSARLPEIAHLAAHHLEQTRLRGNLLMAAGLERAPGAAIAGVPRWERASAADPSYAELCSALDRARSYNGLLAQRAGVSLPAGLREAAEVRGTGPVVAGGRIAMRTPSHVSGVPPRPPGGSGAAADRAGPGSRPGR